MYEAFGAVVEGSRVEFRLFFPDNAVDPSQYVRGGPPQIREIRVRGNFQSALGGADWDFSTAPVMSREPHPSGWLWRAEIDGLPEGYYQYKYFVTFENETSRWCSDPCTRYGGADEHENAAFVIGGNFTRVRPLARPMPLKDLVLYELMIDDFTAEYRGALAPVDAVARKLDYLEELGVNAVAFMPWTSWPGGGFSWGYDPVQFFAVEYRYVHDPTTPADKLFKLKSLINALHDRNIHVIMDGVFNHVRAGIDPNHGFPYFWLYMNPADSPYIGPFERGGFFEEFDYRNGCVSEFIRDVCLYWLEVFGVDGIRFDYTLGFFRRGSPELGISRLVADLRAALAQRGRPDVPLILEHLTDDRYQAIDDTNRISAGACWFDPFMFESQRCARGGAVDGRLLRVLNASLDFAPGKGPITYIENHDHSAIVAEVGGRSRWFKTQAPAITLLTSPGTPMIHNGQEFGEDYWLPHEGPGRVEPRPLRWAQRAPGSGDFAGERLYDVYRRLIEIRRDHPALRSPNFFPYPFNHPDGYGAFPEKGVVVYHRWDERERFIIAVNYSDWDQWLDIPFPANGPWEDLLNDETVTVAGWRLGNYRVRSNWGAIFFQRV